MTKKINNYLEQAIKKHGSAYKFCKAHKFQQGNVSRARDGKLDISKELARAIAGDLATNEDERVRIIGELLK